MPDAPELVLRRALAALLDTHALAVYAPTGQVPELGIKTDGVLPTTVDECTVLSSPPTVDDGGPVNVRYRVQFFTRRTGGLIPVEKWADDLRLILHHAEYTPDILGISWAAEASRAYFDPDSQSRSAVAVTYDFRGRRP